MAETPQQVSERRLLGVGLSFPLRANASGYMTLSAGKTHVWEAIEQLIMTDPLERPYRIRSGIPYGTRIRRLVFEDFEAAKVIAVADITRAIQVWEPRAELLGIETNVDDENSGDGKGASLIITIRYRIRATGTSDFGVIRIPKEGRP